MTRSRETSAASRPPLLLAAVVATWGFGGVWLAIMALGFAGWTQFRSLANSFYIAQSVTAIFALIVRGRLESSRAQQPPAAAGPLGDAAVAGALVAALFRRFWTPSAPWYLGAFAVALGNLAMLPTPGMAGNDVLQTAIAMFVLPIAGPAILGLLQREGLRIRPAVFLDSLILMLAATSVAAEISTFLRPALSLWLLVVLVAHAVLLTAALGAILHQHDYSSLLTWACTGLAVGTLGDQIALLSPMGPLATMARPVSWWIGIAVVALGTLKHVPDDRQSRFEIPVLGVSGPAGTHRVGLSSTLIGGCSVAALGLLLHAALTDGAVAVVVLSTASVMTSVMRLSLTLREVHRLTADLLDSRVDGLTGAGNQRAFRDDAVAAMTDTRSSTALLMCDLTRFRDINDALGSRAGDDLLKMIADRLRNAVDGRARLSRIHGDVFGLVAGRANSSTPLALATRVEQALERPFDLLGLRIQVSPRMGAALSAPGSDPDRLLLDVELALGRAKEEKRNLVVADPASCRNARQRLELLEHLRSAFAQGRLLLHYQPQADVATGRISGVEALIRWHHPERGLLLPGTFMPLVEQHGLMPALNEIVVAQAIVQAMAHVQNGFNVPVAINLPSAAFLADDLPEQLQRAMACAGLDAHCLDLEITEEMLVADIARAREVMTQLRDAGFTISIDDFGTGYSSLSYLAELPLDQVKLDRSFIVPIVKTPRARALVAGVVTMAHDLGLNVLAEGVEDRQTAQVLRELGVDTLQGWLVSRPMHGNILLPFLRSWDRRLATHCGPVPMYEFDNDKAFELEDITL